MGWLADRIARRYVMILIYLLLAITVFIRIGETAADWRAAVRLAGEEREPRGDVAVEPLAFREMPRKDSGSL